MLTGGARIGRGVALWLARAGARHFLLTYNRSERAMTETADALTEMGAQVTVRHMDATRATDVAQVVAAAIANYQSIDILINMASTYEARDIESLTIDTWRADLDNNATTTMLCMAAVAPLMRKRGSGRIINFVDWTAASGRVAYHGYAAYYAAKRAVLGLTEAFALEYAPEVLVNAIAPGPILAPPDLDAATAAAVAEKTPLKRWGGSEEIAEAVGFLIRTNFVTGECIRVDGGRHLL